jgi:hypothetical protein
VRGEFSDVGLVTLFWNLWKCAAKILVPGAEGCLGPRVFGRLVAVVYVHG